MPLLPLRFLQLSQTIQSLLTGQKNSTTETENQMAYHLKSYKKQKKKLMFYTFMHM